MLVRYTRVKLCTRKNTGTLRVAVVSFLALLSIKEGEELVSELPTRSVSLNAWNWTIVAAVALASGACGGGETDDGDSWMPGAGCDDTLPCDESWIVAGGNPCCHAGPPGAEPDDSCDDRSPDPRFTCLDYLQAGECDEPWLVAGDYCTHSCGRCPAVAVPDARKGCRDVPLDPHYPCAQLYAAGECFELWVQLGDYCARSCGRCSD